MSNRSLKAAPAQVPADLGLGDVLKKENARIKLADKFIREKRVPIVISPMYARYLGNTAQISVQGIPVYIPCDGQVWMIPVTHAALASEVIRKVDDQIRKIQRMANVEKNIEPSIGARNF